MLDPAVGPGEVALAEGMEFEGLLVLPKAARIDGRVAGEVCAGGLVEVGPTGRVEADLEADAVRIEGQVWGQVRAHSRVELGPAAVVDGDIAAPRLVMAEGARVNGRCHCGGASAPPAQARVGAESAEAQPAAP